MRTFKNLANVREQLGALSLHVVKLSGVGQLGQQRLGRVDLEEVRNSPHLADQVGLHVTVVNHEQVGPRTLTPIGVLEIELRDQACC